VLLNDTQCSLEPFLRLFVVHLTGVNYSQMMQFDHQLRAIIIAFQVNGLHICIKKLLFSLVIPLQLYVYDSQISENIVVLLRVTS